MIIYFLLVMVGSYIAAKLIAGELRKERRDYVVLVQSSSVDVPQKSKIDEHSSSTDTGVSPAIFEAESAEVRFQKWEQIIADKNLEISKLIETLETKKRQIDEFDKFKALLERQIFESREMNRNLRRDIDALMAKNLQSKQAYEKLQIELNYKNQIINQNEIKLDQFKSRIPKSISDAPSPLQDPAINEGLDLGEFSFDQLDWRKKIDD